MGEESMRVKDCAESLIMFGEGRRGSRAVRASGKAI